MNHFFTREPFQAFPLSVSHSTDSLITLQTVFKIKVTEVSDGAEQMSSCLDEAKTSTKYCLVTFNYFQ